MSTTTRTFDHGAAPDLATAATMPAEAVVTALGSSDQGLSDREAARRLAQLGPNALRSHGARPVTVLLRQLRNPLLLLLLAAAAVSARTGGVVEAVIIAVIVTASVGLGFVNEYRSERAVAALHEQISHRATVLRGGRTTTVDVVQLVPGDVVLIQLGDVVPADLRLVEVADLECEESVLTGESMPSAKASEPTVPAERSASPQDLTSCALMGTVAAQGTGRGVVVRTGTATTFGRITAGLGERHAPTAFQVGLGRFSSFLVAVAGVLTVSIFVINVALQRPLLEALLFSLAIAVGLTPQLLPAIVTVSLASGARHLARVRVLVKRLVAIEDLGNITTLFTDKTGTLTAGEITFDRGLGTDGEPSARPVLLGLVCNDAVLDENGVPVSGNQLDMALWRAASQAGIEARSWRRFGAVPFDHDRRLASVVAGAPGRPPLLITKGEPERILSRCVDIGPRHQALLDELFDAGTRVIAVGTKPAAGQTAPTPADEHGLRFEGFLTFTDPVKDGAAASLRRLADLGITVKVITGDSARVAQRVCADLDLDASTVLTGEQIDALTDTELAETIGRTSVFARTAPQQKARIITIARRAGEDVAFLGDGVNDAVALHHADVGISVDTATDVAKDAADVLLLDKDLGVLADGIEQGRRVFANTMKYVLMATSSNFGNMFSAAGASLFLPFLPMLPSQLLLNNLLYDTGQMAIPTDRVDTEMLSRPSQWDIAFIRRFMAFFGPISSIFDFATFALLLGVLNATQDEFRSGWFIESLATQVLVVLVIRTRRVPFLRSRPSRPLLIAVVATALVGAVLPFSPLAALLGFTPLPPSFFALLVGLIGLYLTLAELGKVWFYRSLAAAQVRRAAPLATRPRHERRIHRRAARFSGSDTVPARRA